MPLIKQQQPQTSPTQTTRTVAAAIAPAVSVSKTTPQVIASVPITLTAESKPVISDSDLKKPNLEMMQALIHLQRGQPNNRPLMGTSPKASMGPKPPAYPPPASLLQSSSSSGAAESRAMTRPSTTVTEERPHKTCKFIPDPNNAAELRLRRMKDKHNEREQKRKARKAAAAAAEAATDTPASS
jgi:hypothetical protein